MPRKTGTAARLSPHLVLAAALLGLPASAQADEPDGLLGLRLELGAMITYDERQIEGTNQDAKVSRDFGLSTSFTVLYNAWKWFHVGLFVDFDKTFDDVSGTTADAWELDVGLLVRLEPLDWLFFNIGYMPLMLRSDSSRTDLPNTKGATDGTFLGSHTVAFLVGAGVQLELSRHVDLFFKLDYRIRYFVKRGGEDLAGGKEYGGQSFYPYLGAAYTF